MLIEIVLFAFPVIGLAFYFLALPRVIPRIQLDKAHVVITGGSSGIGLSVAKEFAKRCSTVTIIARNQQKLDRAKEMLCGLKASVHIVSCDLSGEFHAVECAIEEIVEKIGPIDILFNCAGSSVAKEFDRMDPKVIDDMMRVNYYSAAFVTRAALPKMIARGSGIVVFTSSQAGQIGIYGFAPYSASKFALRGLAESLSMELAPHNISVSLVFPPDTDTPGYAVEQIGKPEATNLISQTAGLFSPDQVAKAVIPKVLAGNFFCSIGLDGWMLASVTAGMASSSGVIQSLVEVSLGGLLRLIGIFYSFWFTRLVKKCNQ